ncbi:MAG: methylmalonyl-CoA epimerase [Thermoplasmata archaeon]|jgi:methylmalonyl-CoA/ethylmalonyl-CoA epimerase|nr:methylmalonyl-CoA epimerase [Thermoplasmata archaeon]MCI4359142.1 methylmalonyl-CoA epimerase [Thermoplasmata archaeon]
MRIDHVGLAVRNLEHSLTTFEPLLATRATTPERVESQRVRVVFLEAGETHFELLEPTEADSPVGRFLERRGEGMHHVAFRVPSVDVALAGVRARGGRLIDEVSRIGARGRRVGFAHPSTFSGTLVEFVEAP